VFVKKSLQMLPNRFLVKIQVQLFLLKRVTQNEGQKLPIVNNRPFVHTGSNIRRLSGSKNVGCSALKTCHIKCHLIDQVHSGSVLRMERRLLTNALGVTYDGKKGSVCVPAYKPILPESSM
jgi:hypothetical protein